MFRHRAELQRWHYGCGNSLPAGGFKKEVDKASPAALTIDVHPEWPMVGRGTDLKALREAYARADEAPVAFLITGEAGIGKSRLVQEFITTLPRGSAVSGSCIKLAGEPIAFAAIEDALRQLANQSDAPVATVAMLSPSTSPHRLAQFDAWRRPCRAQAPLGRCEYW